MAFFSLKLHDVYLERPQMQFRFACKTDKAKIKHFYKQQRYSAGFKGFDKTLLVIEKDIIIAAAIVSKIEQQNHQYLLHGLLVAKQYQGMDIASNILSRLTSHFTPLFCFAERSLQSLYLKNGGKLVDLDTLSGTLQTRFNTYHKHSRDLCIFKLS